MTESNAFLQRLIAARRAAWLVLLLGMALQLFTYFACLAFAGGGFDGLIESGLYGDLTPQQLSILSFAYLAALKLMNIVILMVAVFLTLWVRGIRHTQPSGTPRDP